MKGKNILSGLLSGHGLLYRKYKGRHVLVSGNKVVPLRRGRAGLLDFQRLSSETGRPPVVVFVPREDVSYILNLCL